MAQAAAQCGVSPDQVASVRRWYAEDCCRASVFYQAGARLELEREVLPVENGDGPEADSLPLFVRHAPRIRFHGKVYPTDAPGLYRFVWDPEYYRNVIVVQDDHDVLTPLEGLANLHIHSNRDQDETFKEDFRRRFQTQPWVSANCGGIARAARLMLREVGLSVRQVGTLIMGKPNLYNNGHWMIEVRNPADGRWILADPDTGFLFRDGKNWLNLVEFHRRIVRNEPRGSRACSMNATK